MSKKWTNDKFIEILEEKWSLAKKCCGNSKYLWNDKINKFKIKQRFNKNFSKQWTLNEKFIIF